MTVLALGALLLFPACTDSGLEVSPTGSSIISLSFQNLPTLEGGLFYHAWAVQVEGGIYWGAPLGVFNSDAAGRLVDAETGEAITGEFQVKLFPDEVYGVRVSIEGSSTPVAQPSQTLLLGGEVSGDRIPLSLDHWLGFGRTLADEAGRYTLLTPTDDDPENERSGVWFVEVTGENPAAGLSLPALEEGNTGWEFEGWVEVGDILLSTGKFMDPGLPDSEDLHGDQGDGLAFPGQDFLLNPPAGTEFPLDLAGALLFVTMEPGGQLEVDPAAPSPFRIFQSRIPQGALAGTTYGIEFLSPSLPSGMATVTENVQ